MLQKSVVSATLAVFLLQTSQIWAATPEKTQSEDFEIPKLPSAPPSLILNAPPDPFRCHRRFVYQGKTMDCDNNVRRDGENLRLIVKDVPDAVSQLDAYQHTRKNLRYVAYAASAGLALVLAGYFGTRGTDGFRDSQTHVLTPMAMIALSGAAFGVGSFIYGFAIYQVNESRLNNVVRSYNQARPDSPIELEFKTGIKF